MGSGILDGVNVGAFPGIHFNPEEYTSLILNHGSGAEYRRSVTCPCARIETRQAAMGCKFCRGLGLLYPEDLRGPTIVLDSSRSATNKWAAAGVLPSGTIQVSFPIGVIPAIGDMLLPDEEVHVVEETLWRDDRAVDGNVVRLDRARMVPGRDDPVPQRAAVERLLYPDTTEIERVTYIDEARDAMVAARPADYRVAADGTFTWAAGRGPEPGKAYTVRYRAPAAYIVHSSAPVFRQEASTGMPYKATLGRLDRLSADDLR